MSTEPRKVWPVSGTGGQGFSFETLVGAWASAGLLAGRMPLGEDVGSLRSVRFQAAALGAHLDDFVIEGDRRWSASAKSFDMLAGGKLEGTFVDSAWKCLLSGDFDGGVERIGFVAGRGEQPEWDALAKLMRYAREDHPAALAQRISIAGAFNDLDRELWESARCPPGLEAEHEVGGPARLFRVLVPKRLDLLEVVSVAVSDAVAWCGEALEPGQAKSREDLWTALLTYVDRVRITGGLVDWTSLRSALGGFQFALRPDARADWKLLDHATDQALAQVRRVLGDGVEVPRNRELALLEQADAPVVLLTGPSGCGKSAVARAWTTDSGSRIWLTPGDLDRGLDGLAAELRLSLPLSRVLELRQAPLRLVVDGLDRTFDERHFQSVAELCALLADSDSQIVITCQELEVARVLSRLEERNVVLDAAPVMISNFDSEQVAQVLSASPQLERIRERAGRVLVRPKLLDLVLRAAQGRGGQLPAIVDEPDIARLWWDRFVGDSNSAAMRKEFVGGIAERNGDELRSWIGEGALAELNAFVGAIDGLRSDGILAAERQRYALTHDLFGDWARFLRLGALTFEQLRESLSQRVANPLWHQAIRLHALDLVRTDGTGAWTAAFERTDDPAVADLYLDALILAADSAILEELWPDLVVQRGALLRRLLGRFWLLGTVADPTTGHRIPLPTRWPTLMETLARHSTEAVDTAAIAVAELVELALSRAIETEAATKIALKLGRTFVAITMPTRHREVPLWRAVLATASTHPDEAVGIVLQALARGEADGLREAALSDGALEPLIRADPTRAAEVLLAVAIDAADAREGADFFDDDDETLEITHAAPRNYGAGPFPAMLERSASDGVDVILTLVEHASRRWRKPAYGGHDPLEGRKAEMLFGGEWVPLLGDYTVLRWRRADAMAPRVLRSALLAMEHWLLGLIEAEADVDAVLERMLRTRSLALCGVAARIAVVKPILLLGALQPLVTSAVVLLGDRLDQRGARLRGDDSEIPLDHVVLQTAVWVPELAAALAVARARWAEVDADGWRYLIAQLDPANFAAGENPRVLEFQPPDDLAEEHARTAPALERDTFWAMFPHQMRALINDPQTTFDPEELWESATTQLRNDPPVDLQPIVVREDGECGLAAVLVLRCAALLESQPEIAAWAHERLLAPLLGEQPKSFIVGEDDSSDDRWDVFCAEAIPRLLATTPGDTDVRYAVCRLAAGGVYKTVSTLFRRLSDETTLLDDLRRLQNFVVVVASSRDNVPDAASAFIAGTLSSETPSLRNLETFDLGTILAAIGPTLTLQGTSQQEASRQLTFAAELADVIANRLRAGENLGVAGHAAMVGLATIASDAPGESRSIWEPLLEIASSAPARAATLADCLWRGLLRSGPDRAAEMVLRALLNYGKQESWNEPQLTETAAAVAGLTAQDAWEPRHVGLLESMREPWEAVVIPRIHHPTIATLVAKFITLPAAQPVRFAAIGWLAAVTNVDRALETLVEWLDANTSILVTEGRVGDDARRILTGLSARGSRSAADLTARIADRLRDLPG